MASLFVPLDMYSKQLTRGSTDAASIRLGLAVRELTQYLQRSVPNVLGPIYKISYDHLMIMPKLRSTFRSTIGWLGSRAVSVLDSGAEGPGSNRSRDAVG